MAATGTGFWQRARRLWPWQRLPEPAPDRAAPLPAEMPGVRIGGFALVRTFAQGAFGELHLATDPASGLPVALKTVRFGQQELTRERFLAETAAAARLRHPSIVATYASGIEGEGESALGWIAMEWVPGHDLGRYTEPQRLLPERLALELVARAADGLAHAHHQGVLHRDIKPSNIVVNLAQGVVKITDFGCARLTDGDRSRSGLLIGSPVYMAPEQVAGAPLDGRCDLYALAVLTWQLLTGRLPFGAPSLGELLAQIVHQPAPPLSGLRPDLPPLLSDILARSLEKSPLQRQPNAEQWARDIRLAAAAIGAPGGPEDPSPPRQND